MTHDIQPIERTQKLAEKSTWITAILTFFLPILGYIYTGRYKALFISLAIFVGTTGFAIAGDPSLEDDDDFFSGAGFIYMVATAIENTRAVRKSKKQLQPVNQPDRNIRVKLLKFTKERGEVTLSDLAIEMGLDPQEIRKILNELEREDLMRVSNRSSDGAVVYRVI